MEANIDELGYEYSYLTSYNSKDSSGNSHLKFHNKPASLTGTKKFNPDPEYSVNIPGVNTETRVVLHQEFEEQNIKLMFKESHAKSINLYLRNVILLDRQHIIDLFYNKKLVGNIYKYKKKMRLQSNLGKMITTSK